MYIDVSFLTLQSVFAFLRIEKVASGRGVSLKIRRAVLATAAGHVGGEMYNYFYIFCSASEFSH